jgi:hypothetical protein
VDNCKGLVINAYRMDCLMEGALKMIIDSKSNKGEGGLRRAKK